MATLETVCGVEFQMDDDDVVRFGHHRFHLMINSCGIRYIRCYMGCRNLKKRFMQLHRLIMRTPPHLQVDHLDGDSLNCRKLNLENVSCSVNISRSRSCNQLEEKYITPRNGRFRVRIPGIARGTRKKAIFTKTFDTLDAAIVARDSFVGSSVEMQQRLGGVMAVKRSIQNGS